MRLHGRTYRMLIRQTKDPLSPSGFFLERPSDVEASMNVPLGTEGPSIAFTVEKHLSSSPNTCEITARNLSPRTRAELELDGVKIHLAAGYDGVARSLFVGDVTYARSEKKDGTTWVTTIEVGDGMNAYAQARARPLGYKEGTEAIKVLRDVAASMGLSLPASVEADRSLRTQLVGGHALTGKSRDELTSLLAPYGYTWSIQNGQLQILRDDEVRAGQSFIVSAETGMIEQPVFGKPEKNGGPPKLSVKNALYPELLPGGTAQITARNVEGSFKILKLKHTGDTDGDEWITEIEVKANG